MLWKNGLLCVVLLLKIKLFCIFCALGLWAYLNRKCAWGECVRSEQSSERAKAVELWWGREWLSVCGVVGGVAWLVRLYPHLGRATRGVG